MEEIGGEECFCQLEFLFNRLKQPGSGPQKKEGQHPTSMSIGYKAQTSVASGAEGPVISVYLQVGFRMAGDCTKVNQSQESACRCG